MVNLVPVVPVGIFARIANVAVRADDAPASP
jgi:hypothetical protein